MKVKPLNDRVVVIRLDELEKTAGGIIVPDSAKEKPQQGRVVSTGPGKRDEKGERIAMQVREGDKVMFGKYGGTEIKIDNVDHIFMREDDILAIIEK